MNKYTCCSSSLGRSDPVRSFPFPFPVSFSPVRLCVCVSVRQARLSRVFSRDSIDVSYPYYTLTCITATSSSRSTCSIVAVKTLSTTPPASRPATPPRAPQKCISTRLRHIGVPVTTVRVNSDEGETDHVDQSRATRCRDARSLDTTPSLILR